VKISVALCTYNGEKFLRDQLESIGRQSLLPDELVVCDDGSRDSSLDILREFRRKVSFPVLIQQNEKNLGSTRNFEKAIKLCSGDIIVLCDQDDVWKAEKLEKLKKAFQDNPQVGYVFSDGELVDASLQQIDRTVWESNQFYGETYSHYVNGEQLLCFLRWQIVTGATMAFRSRLKEYIFPFPEHKIWIHDGWIAVVGSSIGEIGLPLAEALISYRQHDQQQMGGNLTDKAGGLWNDLLALKENRNDFIQGWADASAFFDALRRHLMGLPISCRPATQKSIATLEEFARHFQNRLKIFAASRLGKIPFIAGELFTGRYKKFSNSWKSAIADLLF
jgi:glycosyltransferase involved in cell wall biosynthesis